LSNVDIRDRADAIAVAGERTVVCRLCSCGERIRGAIGRQACPKGIIGHDQLSHRIVASTREQGSRTIDIYAQINDGTDYFGIKCKVRSGADGGIATLTVADIRQDVEQAKTFIPALKRPIIVTTAASDVKTQASVRELSKEHVRLGLFAIDVLAWPEIVARLSQHEDVLERFYPGASARWKRMADKVDELHDLATGRRAITRVTIAPWSAAKHLKGPDR
jgi:hypothetical protein